MLVEYRRYFQRWPASSWLQAAAAAVIYLFQTVIVCMCHGCKVLFVEYNLGSVLFHSSTYCRHCRLSFSRQQNIWRFSKFVFPFDIVAVVLFYVCAKC